MIKRKEKLRKPPRTTRMPNKHFGTSVGGESDGRKEGSTPSCSPKRKRKETEVIMQAVEMYKGYVAISARWLIENGIITKVNYDQLCHRHHIRVVRRGCKGTPALVDWQSMPQEIKGRIEGIIGNPNDVAKQECMLRNIVEHRRANCKDIEAWDYFSSVRGADGRMLEREKVEKLTNSARILAAIGECLDLIKQAATMRKQRFSVLREFERL